MSNFTCPTCGLTNIDCGKDGYKTAREIELEKKLEIAVEALKRYADKKNWEDCYINIPNKGNLCDVLINGAFKSNGYEEAQQALKEMSL